MPRQIDVDSSYIFVGAGETPKADKFAQETVATETTQIHPSHNPSYLPGSTASYGHDWSVLGTKGALSLYGRHFIDGYGRVCQLRGVNLSGCTKSPVNDDHHKFPVGHESVTFVGRPFPLEEAPEHFSRLRRWGLTFVRFLVTWEAVEHAGPGIYDMEYLTYVRSLLSILPQYGICAFVSIHQDVWSRYSGGSGAPAWTLELAGFDLSALEETGAAWLKGVKGGGHNENERGVWPSGYTKLAAATMATLFWAGDVFAPRLLVNDGSESIQKFLQDAYIAMSEVVIKAIGDLEGVIGFEMMNEPHRGYINLESLHSFDYNTDLHLSFIPSAFQSFLLGAGHPTPVSHYTRSFPMPTRETSKVVLNPEKRKVWRADGPTGGKCVWQMHGVWGWDRNRNGGVVLRESYFVKHPHTNKKIDWYVDFYYPFLKRWTERMRGVTGKDKIIFVEAIPNEFCPKSWTEEYQVPNMVYAPHWYDLNALFAKAFGDFTVNVQGLSRGMFPLQAFYWGQKGSRDNFSLQIQNIVEHARESLGEKPLIFGECGVPMDMNRREAFETGDFTFQARMMDAMITGLERALVGFSLWTYNPSNSDALGDDWNGENFSWFSRSRALPPSLLYHDQDAVSLDQGARILEAIVRPYPAKVAGVPVRFRYEMNTGEFEFEWVSGIGGSKEITSDRDARTSSNKDTMADGYRPNDLVAYLGAFAEKYPHSSSHPPPPLTSHETEIFLPSMLTHGRDVVVQGLEAEDKWLYDEKRQTLFIVAKSAGLHRVRVRVSPGISRLFEVRGFWDEFGGRIISFWMVVVSVLMYWGLMRWNSRSRD